MPVVMFAGQGSQRQGMGEDLFDRFPEHMAISDEVLGWSVRDVCLNDFGRLSHTEYAQPALYVVNVLSYLDLSAKGAFRPDAVLGHSLGEYCALHVAGVFDFRTGLELVAARGRLMAQSVDGGMAAVVGLDAAAVRAAIADWPDGGLWAANYNSPEQTVISGVADSVKAAREHFLGAGARAYVPLNVSGAFHSPLMAQAQSAFAGVLGGVQLSPPRIPVVSNLAAAIYTDELTESFLGEQITSPVRWTESVQLLAARGESEWVEIGPKRVLTTLVERTLCGQR